MIVYNLTTKFTTDSEGDCNHIVSEFVKSLINEIWTNIYKYDEFILEDDNFNKFIVQQIDHSRVFHQFHIIFNNVLVYNNLIAILYSNEGFVNCSLDEVYFSKDTKLKTIKFKLGNHHFNYVKHTDIFNSKVTNLKEVINSHERKLVIYNNLLNNLVKFKELFKEIFDIELLTTGDFDDFTLKSFKCNQVTIPNDNYLYQQIFNFDEIYYKGVKITFEFEESNVYKFKYNIKSFGGTRYMNLVEINRVEELEPNTNRLILFKEYLFDLICLNKRRIFSDVILDFEIDNEYTYEVDILNLSVENSCKAYVKENIFKNAFKDYR